MNIYLPLKIQTEFKSENSDNQLKSSLDIDNYFLKNNKYENKIKEISDSEQHESVEIKINKSNNEKSENSNKLNSINKKESFNPSLPSLEYNKKASQISQNANLKKSKIEENANDASINDHHQIELKKNNLKNLQMNDFNINERRELRSIKNNYYTRTNTINPKNIIESWYANHPNKNSKNSLNSISESIEHYSNDNNFSNKKRINSFKKNNNINYKISKKDFDEANFLKLYSPNNANMQNMFNNFHQYSNFKKKENNKSRLNSAKPEHHFNDSRNLKTGVSTKLNTGTNIEGVSRPLTGLSNANNINYVMNKINKNDDKKRKPSSAKLNNLKRLIDVSPYANIPKKVKYSWVNLPGMNEKFTPKIPRSLQDNQGNRFKHVSHGTSTIFLKQEKINEDFLTKLLKYKLESSSDFVKAIKIKNIRRLISIKTSKIS